MKNVPIVIDVQNDYFPGGAYPLGGAADAVQSEVKKGRMNTTHPPLFRRVTSGKGLRSAERPPPFAGADIEAGLETLAERYR